MTLDNVILLLDSQFVCFSLMNGFNLPLNDLQCVFCSWNSISTEHLELLPQEPTACHFLEKSKFL